VKIGLANRAEDAAYLGQSEGHVAGLQFCPWIYDIPVLATQAICKSKAYHSCGTFLIPNL
jgi:hypothetical protein